VKPAPFRYAAPASLDEALALLAAHGGEAKLLAGGQSLVPLLNLRLARPSVVVDMGRLPGLDGWRESDGAVEIEALARQRKLEVDRALAERLPLLAEAARWIGHVATRSRGTIVGSLCHADPAAELPVCAVALQAEVQVRAAKGARRIAARDFFVDAMTTRLAEDELVQSAIFPAWSGRSGFACLEVARRHGDFALVVVACALQLDERGAIARAGLALGGIDRTPLPAAAGEAALMGAQPNAETFREVAALTADALDPPSDLHASGRYRKRAARTLVERALTLAAERAATRTPQ
jgi:CO/xanthine dehydrogenase FAD-binding subunit